MPCTECGTLLLDATYAKDNHRYSTTCPQCGSMCIYIPKEHGIGNVDLTYQEVNVLKSVFGSSL